MTPTPRIFALIVAAGTGSRAGGAVPKQYAQLGGKALLAYSCAALGSHPSIAGVQVVIHPEHQDFYAAAMQQGVPRPAGEATRLHERSEFSRSGEGASALAAPRPHPDFLSAGALGNPTSPEGRGAPVASLAPKLLPPVIGGAERADSVRAGLAALAPHAPDYVLIHDAARPFLSHVTLSAIIVQLTPEHAVIPALAVADTVRRFDGAAWSEVSRDGLLRVQTPQGFDFTKIKSMMNENAARSVVPPPLGGRLGGGHSEHKAGSNDSYSVPLTPPPQPSPCGVGSAPVAAFAPPSPPTDEAAVWLAAGGQLRYVTGDEELRKVTTAEDMIWAEKHTAARRVAVGMGYDVHALVPSGEAGVIRLGGVDIAHDKKLHGHSDADVVLHAVVDALLGAIAAGDIGSHFPPSDARWKGANSAIFVEEARAQVAARGGEISHLDITVIGEQPKISPHRDAMRAAIAALLKLPLSRVSVKATTTEKLGFTGREEGMACHAIATITLPMDV